MTAALIDDPVAALDAPRHTVSDPARAEQFHPHEALGAVLTSLIVGLVAAGVFVALIPVGMYVWANWMPRSFPNFFVALIVMAVLSLPWIGAFGALAASLWSAIRLVGGLVQLVSPPRQRTPGQTLRTFFRSLRNSLWGRAYNCLTDQAQRQTHLEAPDCAFLPYGILRTAKFDSIETFQRYWAKYDIAAPWSFW
jgi:hypothetical protein